MGRAYSTDEFVAKAKKIHGDTLDFSQLAYVNNKTKVAIICPVHGLLMAWPKRLLNNHGCRKCSRDRGAKKRILSEHEVMKRFHDAHGDRYDYSEVAYKGCDEPVEIICRTHGNFPQTPTAHWGGQGCPDCGKEKTAERNKQNRHPREEVIRRFCDKHGDTYIYDSVVYEGLNKKVTIICRKHGEFPQTPKRHWAGDGCPDCGGERTAEARRVEDRIWLKRFREKHGDKYDYSCTVFTGDSHKNVNIRCRVEGHGIFPQSPASHATGIGCPDCGREQANAKMRLSLGDFIQKAHEVHEGKYDYSLIEKLEGTKEYVPIKCPQHGKFRQSPNNHLKGAGCPDCQDSKGERSIRQFLEKHNVDFESQKTFPGLHDPEKGWALRFDFFISDGNLLIEFDGRQHFEEVDFSGKLSPEKLRDQFNRIQYLDRLKNDFCRDNNVDLLRISYKDIDAISDLLKRELRLRPSTPPR